MRARFIFCLILLLFSPHSLTSTEMAPQLVNPQLFTQSRSNGWKCLICPHSNYTVLSQAIRHEDRQSHDTRVRTLDREAAPMSSPLRTTTRVDPGKDSDSESGNQSDSSSDTGPSRTIPPSCEEDDLFAGLPFSAPTTSVHGPALASDDPDQIYDDFSGELARNRPSFQNLDSDDDDDDDNYPDLLQDSFSRWEWNGKFWSAALS
ncbi:hypothetical protein MSAN_02475000 [Mycena sanguinolenta]|uniref:Uncharacterized protein n=1 Tax=Mycena sanguinolenta TaxID=230812 RepID=A0A8H6U541_9AGAR|nr:hypothetical protein MSAN_02475000 [Mycena sanguinolenta]